MPPQVDPLARPSEDVPRRYPRTLRKSGRGLARWFRVLLCSHVGLVEGGRGWMTRGLEQVQHHAPTKQVWGLGGFITPPTPTNPGEGGGGGGSTVLDTNYGRHLGQLTIGRRPLWGGGGVAQGLGGWLR